MLFDGKRVRAFLKAQDKSKEWLAVQLNCSLDTVNRMLGGKVPSGERLAAVAALMGCKVEDLVSPKADHALRRPA